MFVHTETVSLARQHLILTKEMTELTRVMGPTMGSFGGFSFFFFFLLSLEKSWLYKKHDVKF